MGILGTGAQACAAEDPGFKRNRDFARDMFNLVVGIVWQVSLVALPLYIVIQEFERAAITLGSFWGRRPFSSSHGTTILLNGKLKRT